MLEGGEEPAQGVQVLEAVLGHGEVAPVGGLEDEVGAGDLHGVDDLQGVLAGQQERGDGVDVGRLGRLGERRDQLLRLLRA